MKVGFFLLKFPLSSETFVLNQIVAFIEMGHEVRNIALQKGDMTNTHAAYTQYNLAAKTRWLQDEPTSTGAKFRHRAMSTLRGLHRPATLAGAEHEALRSRSAQPDPLGHLWRQPTTVPRRCVYRSLRPGGRHGSETARTGCEYAAKSPPFFTALISPAAMC